MSDTAAAPVTNFPPRSISYAHAWAAAVDDPLGEWTVELVVDDDSDDGGGLEMLVVVNPVSEFVIFPSADGNGVTVDWFAHRDNHQVWAPDVPAALALFRPTDPQTMAKVWAKVDADLFAFTAGD